MTNPIFERIQQDISENDVLLFMKGSPMFPQCGFSAAVVKMLKTLGVDFKGIDIFSDSALRDGLKEFSNWPTFPQLYVGGEFVGGCDIIREMSSNGELVNLLRDKGISVTAPATADS